MVDIDEQKRAITEAVGARIRYFRHVRSMSQEDLALRASVNPAYFGQVERGLKCPTVDTLYKIAKALDVPLPELLRTDALPEYTTANHAQRIQDILARVPVGKQEQLLKVLEDIAVLF